MLLASAEQIIEFQCWKQENSRRKVQQRKYWKKLCHLGKEISVGKKVSAAGISCGGPLDSSSGLILSPPNLPGWDHVPAVKIVTETLGVPCHLQNDADACALAEWKFGAGRGTRNMAFLTCGTGFGAGLIIDGKLYSGSCNMAGEIGHIRAAEDGPVGYGKAGSFEGFCSGGGIAQMAKNAALEKLQMGKGPAYCNSYEKLEYVTAKSTAEAAMQGDPTAIEVYERCGYYLGRAAGILIDLLNLDAIVLGSIFPRAEGLLRHKMEETIRRECLPLNGRHCRILCAELGEQIGNIAALTVAMVNS